MNEKKVINIKLKYIIFTINEKEENEKYTNDGLFI